MTKPASLTYTESIDALKKRCHSVTEKFLSFLNIPPRPHKHQWRPTRIDAWGGKRYGCLTCESEGVRHERNNYDMKVLVRSEKAKQLPHEHAWCFEFYGGREEGADPNAPMSKVYSCECGKFAVKHHGKQEFFLNS